ncbi:hypothetical protein DENSPDRAFT_662374 [Dentipellis sp. KUC8613]|nr:hypothetical protein DENSPDRAFT_662374 [Dentipellis sp. KUC8613]
MRDEPPAVCESRFALSTRMQTQAQDRGVRTYRHLWWIQVQARMHGLHDQLPLSLSPSVSVLALDPHVQRRASLFVHPLLSVSLLMPAALAADPSRGSSRPEGVDDIDSPPVCGPTRTRTRSHECAHWQAASTSVEAQLAGEKGQRGRPGPSLCSRTHACCLYPRTTSKARRDHWKLQACNCNCNVNMHARIWSGDCLAMVVINRCTRCPWRGRRGRSPPSR